MIVSYPWFLASWCLIEWLSLRRRVGVVVEEQTVGVCERRWGGYYVHDSML